MLSNKISFFPRMLVHHENFYQISGCSLYRTVKVFTQNLVIPDLVQLLLDADPNAQKLILFKIKSLNIKQS